MNAWGLLDRGGVVIWIIAALSVIALALILWKISRLWRLGVWSGQAVGEIERHTAKARKSLPAAAAREESERVAKAALGEAAEGLRGLEVIATIAPLLGLLGTVLGMIAAFQAMEATGQRADPAVLAGGIWEALLTTAAGMGVAIPVQVALAWFDSVVARLARQMEDALARVFVAT